MFRTGKPVQINFIEGYRFYVEENEQGRVLRCNQQAPSVPSSFYEEVRGVPSSVTAVSAIVGDNGSGKSTLASFLQVIRMGTSLPYSYIIVWESDILGGQDSGDHKTNLKKYVSWSGGKNLSICDELKNEAFITDEDYPTLKHIKETFDYIYYSPHFEPEDAFSLDLYGNGLERTYDSGACLNLSTTALFFSRPDKVYNKEINRNTDVSFISRGYLLEQRRWIVDFIRKCNKKELSDHLRNSLPVSVVVDLRNDMLSVNIDYFNGKARQEQRDPFYGRIESLIANYNGIAKKPFELNLLMGFALAFWRTYDASMMLSPDKAAFVLLDAMDSLVHKGERINETACRKTIKKMCGFGAYFASLKSLYDALLKVRSNSKLAPDEYSVLYPIRESDTYPWKMDINVLFNIADYYAQTCSLYDYMEFKFSPPLSSGEFVMLRMLSRLWYAFNRPLRGGNVQSNLLKKDVLILMDEAETSLHPEWQRELVSHVVMLLNSCAYGYRAHVVFLTHSPILLSDIPIGNVAFLRRRDGGSGDSPWCEVVDPKKVLSSETGFTNTFFGNVNDLYSLPFFLDRGTSGNFATRKVKEALDKNAEMPMCARKKIVQLIGDPIIRRIAERHLADMEQGK